VRLEADGPFDGAGVLEFLECRCVPGIDEVTGDSYRRAGVIVTVDPGGATVAAEDPTDAVPKARRLLDLDADVAAVAEVLGADPVLRPLVAAAPGLRVPGAWDGFELVVRAVVGQQVTVAAARTLLRRVVDRCGGVLTPESVLAADLDGIGMPASRTGTLRTVAAAIADGSAAADNPASLLALRGIGPWTAGYVGVRTGDRDAFPVGDAGLRIAAGRLGLPTEAQSLLAHAERWRPFRAYATLHLWRTL
jgi:AraC family transcriptional regulator, regulatory protein of adaptative response / DNA-3-methyladenine glycosylase II